jgi:hypothetical protein
VKKVEADRPVSPFVLFVKSALDQIPNHGNQLVKSLPLSRHFWLVASRNEHVVVLFDLKDEFFFHKGFRSKLCALRIDFASGAFRGFIISASQTIPIKWGFGEELFPVETSDLTELSPR